MPDLNDLDSNCLNLLRHSFVSSSQLQKSLVKLNLDIVLLQEPYVNKFKIIAGAADKFYAFITFTEYKRNYAVQHYLLKKSFRIDMKE